MDSKYSASSPNIFYSNGWWVMAKVLDFGKILGLALPLVVQNWDLYCICREQCHTIQQIWDGQTLKLTFRRIFNENVMNLWYELEEIAKSIAYSDGCDSLIWQYENSGQYFSSSLYIVINLEGPLVYLHVV